MTILVIPTPDNNKAIALLDLDGGAVYNIPCTITDDGQIDTGSNLAVGGLQLTTSGVSDSVDKRFVTDAELADLVTLQGLASVEAVLAAVGALTGAETLLNSAAAVNLNTATAQTLYTVPGGKSAIITRVVIRLASTSLDTVSFSIGFNSTDFDDVIANNTHVELTGNTLYTILAAKAGAKVGTAAGVLKLKNNTLQGAACTVTVDVFGYLL